MSRLTLGIFFSLVIVMFITAYNYTPQTVEGNTCQVGTVCSKPDCCNKEKSCGSGCVKPCCKQNVVKTCAESSADGSPQRPSFNLPPF